jgi:acylphosphatase
MTAKRLTISGRVHGVGFRDWVVGQARMLGLSGWVRNRRDGSVEVLLDGDTAAVEEMVRACRRGPRLAEVTAINEELAEPAEEPGFLRLPTI